MHKDRFQVMTQRNTQGLQLLGHYVEELLQHCSHSHAFDCSLQKHASMYVHTYIHTHLDYTKEISMHWHSALVSAQPTTYIRQQLLYCYQLTWPSSQMHTKQNSTPSPGKEAPCDPPLPAESAQGLAPAPHSGLGRTEASSLTSQGSLD